jgi:acyl-homoserine-lactone acylase
MIDMKKLLPLLFVVVCSVVGSLGQSSKELWRQVEIIRTEHGVPHIRAENLRAAGYALAWVQCEDYGPSATPMSILQASGRRASVEGAEFVEPDFFILRHRERTLKNYGLLSRDVREIYEGFAAGVNRYIEMHRSEFPSSMPADFTAMDIAATEIIPFSTRKVRNFVNRLNGNVATARESIPPAVAGGTM